jgi:hypothetical protein
MSWWLRLVERVDGGDGRSVDVVDIGEITAPTELAMLGLSTVTAKSVLAKLQSRIVTLQEAALTDAARRSPRPIKDHRRRVLQTPFGTVALRVPRLRGRSVEAKLVTWPRHARSTPEFDRLRARLAASMSYPAAMALLQELYPAASGVGLATAHRTMARVASGLMQTETIDATPAAAHATLQLDTAFVRSADPARPRGLEILVGAIEPEGGGRRCFAAPVSLRAQSLAVGRDAIAAAGCGEETAITALTDGAVLMRCYARELGAADLPISDWFHISMRIRHIEASARAIDDSHPAVAKGKQEVLDALERMRHRLWNGHKTAAQDASRTVRAGLREHPDEPMRKGRAKRNSTVRRGMKKMVEYVGNPQARLVNYAERHRAGERVATSLVEGGADHLVNARMARTQHMRWSEQGAFNLLQVRAAHFNQRLAQAPVAA